MEVTKIQLPIISFSSYELLLKALRYYLYASTQFIIDAEITMGLCETIDYMEQSHKEVNAKIQLPTIYISSYQLMLNALKYYIVSSTEFIMDTELSIQICELMNYMEKEQKEVKIQ